MGPLILLLGILGAGGLWYQVHKNDPKNTRYQLTFPPESDGEPLRQAVFNIAEALGGFLESANGHGGYIVSIPPHIAQGQVATAVIALGAPGIAKISGDTIDVPGFDYVQRNNDRALVPHVDVYLQPDGRFYDDTGPTASLRRMNEAGGSVVSGEERRCIHGGRVNEQTACRTCGWELDAAGNPVRGRTEPVSVVSYDSAGNPSWQPYRRPAVSGTIVIAGQRWDGQTLTGPTTHQRQGIADGGRTLADNGTRRRRTW